MASYDLVKDALRRLALEPDSRPHVFKIQMRDLKIALAADGREDEFDGAILRGFASCVEDRQN